MTDISAPFVVFNAAVSEDGIFTYIFTPSVAFSSPEKFRWEITFGQGGSHRGIIAFKAGEVDTRSISQSIDPDGDYQFRVYRVSDNNNDADDELLFQQQSEPLPFSLKDDTQPAEVKGEQGTDITQINATLVLNKNETTIIDADALLYMHPTDPNAELTYTLTAAPVGGEIFRDGTELGDGDTFTQRDIDTGLISYYVPVEGNVSPSIVFTVSAGSLTLLSQTLTITPRVIPEVENLEEDNTIGPFEAAPQKINGGDGNDTITGSPSDDQIEGGAGDDDIILSSNAQEDSGTDEVFYTFGFDGVGIDGGDAIRGFKRGQDKLILTAHLGRKVPTLTEFLQNLNGPDGADLTDDDAFIVTMMWGLDEDDAFYFDGVLLHFKEGTSFGGGRLSSPVVQITFDQRLDFDDLIEILGGAENVDDNFDGDLTAFKNLDEVLPRLFGEDSIGFEILNLPPGVTSTSSRIPINTVGQAITPIDIIDLFDELDSDRLTLDVSIDGDRALSTIGLSYNDETKEITGTPTKIGIHRIVVVATDSNGAIETFTFTIGVSTNNNLPTITGTSGGEVTEDDLDPAKASATGELEVTYVNDPPTPLPIVLLDGVGKYGTMVLVGSTWTYTLDEAKAQALKDGETDTDIFTFMAGSASFVVTIMATGVNDDPVLGTAIVGAGGTQGQNITVDMSTLFTDADGDILDLMFTVMLGEDEVTLDNDNTLSYDRNTRILTIKLADTGRYTIEVQATDGGTGPAVTSEFALTIVAQQIMGDQVGAVVEDDSANKSAMGTIGLIDALGSSTVIELAGGGVGQYGTMTFNVISGEWIYTLDEEKSQVLKEGEEDTDAFTFTAGDASFVVTITATGVDDEPVANAESFEISGLVDGNIAIDLNTLFNDPDGDELDLTFTAMVLANDSTREELSTIGLEYDSDTKMITGTPTKTGIYTIEVIASGDSITDNIVTIFGIRIVSDDILGYVGRPITEIDLSSLFTGFGDEGSLFTGFGVALTVTVRLENGDTLRSIGLEYDPNTKTITGTPTKSGTYTIKVMSSHSASGQDYETTLNLVVQASLSQAPTLTFVEEQVEANADFTATGDSVDLTNPIVPIVLGNQFADIDGNAVTLVLDGGSRELSDIGLSYDPDTKTITGMLTEFGTYTIVASAGNDVNGNAIERTIVIVAESDKTLPQIIQIDDPDTLIDNPDVSSRNQVGIRVGAKGGSADDVTAARTDLLSDYYDSDVSVLAPTDTTDTEEEYVVEGEYGRFIITRVRGGEAPDGSSGELSYYYEYYQDGEANFKNIRALAAGEKAYDVLTIWAFDGLTDAELAQLTVVGGPHDIPESALDRRVSKTVVVEVTGVNDAPEVVTRIHDIFFNEGQTFDIRIDSNHFFDPDGDSLILRAAVFEADGTTPIDIRTRDIGLRFEGQSIVGRPISGTWIIKITATEMGSGGESASYQFVLSSNRTDIIDTQPVVQISGTQVTLLKGHKIEKNIYTGLNVSVTDRDDINPGGEDGVVSYSFYLLGAVETFNNGQQVSINDRVFTDQDGKIFFTNAFRLRDDFTIRVVATDGEGSESAPKDILITITDDGSPILERVGVEEEEVLENVSGAQLHRLRIDDSDNTAAGDFTSSSFTITGIEADKFTIKQVDGRWYLFLKDGVSFDHEALENDVLELQITVSDGTNTSNTVDVVVRVIDVFEEDNPLAITSADRGFYHQTGARDQVVYQAQAEGDVVGVVRATYSIKQEGAGDMFAINPDTGEVRFKPGSIPGPDVGLAFEITIIAEGRGDRAEKTVTIYNNARDQSDVGSTGEAASQQLGFVLGTQDVTQTDTDGTGSITYYWFVENDALIEFIDGADVTDRLTLQRLLDGELFNGEGAVIKPLAGEDNKELTLKREYVEKEIWRVTALTDADGYTTYRYNSSGRFDIGSTPETALALEDIGIERNGGILEFLGDSNFTADPLFSDADLISFTVGENEILIIRAGSSDSATARYTIQSIVDNPQGPERVDVEEVDISSGDIYSFTINSAGDYYLQVRYIFRPNAGGLYRLRVERNIDDKPTDLQLTGQVVELALNADLSNGKKVGVLTITDDLYGTNMIILTGANAALFEIRDTSNRLVKELWLKANDDADFGTIGSTLTVTASVEGDGRGTNPVVTQTFTITVGTLDVSDLDQVFFYGVESGRTIDNTSGRFLIGGDNAQQLRAGIGGDVIFGGRGDDMVSLGEGKDFVIYRYDGTDTTDSVALDGADVITGFDLSEDYLILAHAGGTGSVHSNATAFYKAIKGVSLLVDGSGDITGIVFTFTDRADGVGANDEVVLTVNFDDVFAASQIDLTAFDAAASGSNERVIKTGQETAAYQAINKLFGNNIILIDFEDIGFVLNSEETVAWSNFINFKKVLGNGVDNASVGADTVETSQFLLGGDNAQTLNAGLGGNAIFGGKGDDTINLGEGQDFVFYRYDGMDATDSVAHDGADVINGFDRLEDHLVLAHEGNNVHGNSTAFYNALEDISLLVNDDGEITGIVFTFARDEVDLTVNFNSIVRLLNQTQMNAVDDAFGAADESGVRAVRAGQRDAANEVLNIVFRFDQNLVLIDFEDIGFELNPTETDIV